jgi:hypothetical protein
MRNLPLRIPCEKGEQCVVLQSCRASFFIEVIPQCSATPFARPLPSKIGVNQVVW